MSFGVMRAEVTLWSSNPYLFCHLIPHPVFYLLSIPYVICCDPLSLS